MAGQVFGSVSMSLDGVSAADSTAELVGRLGMVLAGRVLPLRVFG